MKRIAFIPVDRGQFNESPQGVPGFAVPADWQEQIESRIYFNRDPITGLNVSLRDYIYTTSQGRADLEGVVLDIVRVSPKDVPPSFLASRFEEQLRHDGFDAGALVMLGGQGAGQGEAGKFWARFAMAEGVGVWAMELTHVLSYYMDLYTNDRANDLNNFDNMDLSGGMHPTAYTKVQLGWLDKSAITAVTGSSAEYDLHSIGLVQPAPTGRITAAQIKTNGTPLFVEARQRVDRYEGPNSWNAALQRWDPAKGSGGIPSEGVIVYELAGVEDPHAPAGEIDPLIRLHTQTALTPGQSITRQSVTVRVLDSLVGGFRVRISNLTGSGMLLRYQDLTDQGTPGHSDPIAIGQGGWQAFKFVLAGDSGVIYAVNTDGQLLRYQDLTDQGTVGHSDPIVIGQGGWQAFKFVLAGDSGVIYAVNTDGQLLRYQDLTDQGTVGHSDPIVIGLGGWQAFKFVLAGDNKIIYSVVP
jgi:outer membrane protein assembly factor BamB